MPRSLFGEYTGAVVSSTPPVPECSAGALETILHGPGGRVHMVGIAGVGMAGLAVLLKARGFRVDGCDLAPGGMGEWLSARGIAVRAGHDPAHLDERAVAVIRSAAVGSGTPEIERAAKMGVPVFVRGAVLSRLLDGRLSVAVAGTHGKTTTSSFIVQVLRAAGRDLSWCVGGVTDDETGVAGAGDDPDGLVVAEADESDGTVQLYSPAVSVITNVDFDHMEHFDSVEAFEACFRALVSNTTGRVVFCRDDERALRLCSVSAVGLSFGFSAGEGFRAVDVAGEGTFSVFSLCRNGRELGRVRLPVPGRHNVLNALAAAAACAELGLSPEEIVCGLESVKLPKRRFETVVDRGGVRVISDYAHHPAEIASLVETARGLRPSGLSAVFQPHRYTRTRALGGDFPAAFSGVDELVLTPVYAASEEPVDGGTLSDLYAHFRAGTRGPGVVSVARSPQQAWEYLRGELRPGGTLLVVGAGDVVTVADRARKEYETDERPGAGREEMVRELSAAVPGTEFRAAEPLAEKTFMGVGGAADCWAAISSREALAAILGWSRERGIPFTVLGAGSNVLAGDLGVRGIVGRLTGPAFGQLEFEGGDIVAGAGVPTGKLLAVLEDRGLAGAEFLEGIPGTMGGAVVMNAGATGRAMADVIRWIRCLNRDGTECIVRREDMELGYRRCGCVGDRVVTDVCLGLERSSPADVGRKRRDIAGKRAWMKGLRCAGSVFLNPPGDFAGRLVEAAGYRGARLGGATVCDAHANVITTEEGCRASDVLVLIETIRKGVFDRFAATLETEIVILDR